MTVIGPSGSGKTTLLRCVNFLESYDGGSIRIDGKEVGYSRAGNAPAPQRARPGRDARRDRHGVPELQPVPASDRRRQHHARPAPRCAARAEAEARQIAEHWLGRVGLAHKADSLPAELSGGQQQRVGIARAVAMEPKILLLDEITSALDPELVGEVLDVVRSLAEDGMTMLMVTHEMAFARDASSRIVFMADGGVSAVGPPTRSWRRETSTTSACAAFLARFRASHF